MEKIFDIAKDSEQKWGVIAQGIDRNFEETDLELDNKLREKSIEILLSFLITMAILLPLLIKMVFILSTIRSRMIP